VALVGIWYPARLNGVISLSKIHIDQNSKITELGVKYMFSNPFLILGDSVTQVCSGETFI